MRNLLFLVFFSALFLLFSCKKEKDPALSLDLSGRYIGKTVSTSLHQEEIFTSPTESHYEWFHDSATYAPDTLTVTQLGTDSFALQGLAASFLPTEWRTYAYQESAGPEVFNFERHLVLSGYLTRNLSLSFDLAHKTLILNYQSEGIIPPANREIAFSGSK